jgi:hypothetical protein
MFCRRKSPNDHRSITDNLSKYFFAGTERSSQLRLSGFVLVLMKYGYFYPVFAYYLILLRRNGETLLLKSSFQVSIIVIFTVKIALIFSSKDTRNHEIAFKLVLSKFRSVLSDYH